jgi:hypothetical protein
MVYMGCTFSLGAGGAPLPPSEIEECKLAADHAFEHCMDRKTRDDCYDDCDAMWLNMCPPNYQAWNACYAYCADNFLP